MNGKTIFQILMIIILSAIFMPGQGQTDQSTTTTTNDAEIHDYDITINSLENSHYKLGLKNNLLLSELDVFFDGEFVGSIPKGPTWKEFEVDKLPTKVRISGEGKAFTKILKKNAHDARSPMWIKMGKTYLFSNHSLDCETSDTGRSYLAV